MEKSRTTGPPTSKSRKAAELRQQFWDKQPEHRRLRQYENAEPTASHDYAPMTSARRSLGAVAAREKVTQGIHETTGGAPESAAVVAAEYDDGSNAATDVTRGAEHETEMVPSSTEGEHARLDHGEEHNVQYSTPEQILNVLDTQRPHYAQIYRTVLDLFPSIRSIRQIGSLGIKSDSRENFSGGLRHDVTREMYPEIHIGEAPLLPYQKERMKKRFGYENLSDEEFDSLPNDFWMQYVFAHEIGHAIQHDENFESIFGDMQHLKEGDDTLSQRDYKAYVNLDAEKNADYIAQMVVSNSVLGKQARLPQPAHPPREWRKAVVDL